MSATIIRFTRGVWRLDRERLPVVCVSSIAEIMKFTQYEMASSGPNGMCREEHTDKELETRSSSTDTCT